MNDAVIIQLKVVVERAVRPVRASFARKRRMREELLDHLTSMYEQELELAGNEADALERAKQRFGDPRDLTMELQRSMSPWEPVRYVLDWPRYRAGESVLYFAFRHVLLSVFFMAGGFLLALPVIWLRGRNSEIGIVLHILLVMSVFSASFSFAFSFFVEHMGQIWYGGGSERPGRAMIFYVLASLAVFPLLAFFTYWALLGSLGSGLSGFFLGCTVAPATPVFFFLQARQMKDEIRHESEWAGIELE